MYVVVFGKWRGEELLNITPGLYIGLPEDEAFVCETEEELEGQM